MTPVFLLVGMYRLIKLCTHLIISVQCLFLKDEQLS